MYIIYIPYMSLFKFSCRRIEPKGIFFNKIITPYCSSYIVLFPKALHIELRKISDKKILVDMTCLFSHSD